MFWICRSCDRGQQYCSERCRQKSRRQQRREANRRHQQSPEGRMDHRDRQREWRRRRCSRVTDQSSPLLLLFDRITAVEPLSTESGSLETAIVAFIQPNYETRCTICGCRSLFVDPFRDWG